MEKDRIEEFVDSLPNEEVAKLHNKTIELLAVETVRRFLDGVKKDRIPVSALPEAVMQLVHPVFRNTIVNIRISLIDTMNKHPNVDLESVRVIVKQLEEHLKDEIALQVLKQMPKTPSKDAS